MTDNEYHDPRQMSPDEYKRIIKRLGLTQQQAGEFLGQHPVTGQRHAAEGISGPAAMLLRLIDFMGIDPKEANRFIEMHRQGKRLDNA